MNPHSMNGRVVLLAALAAAALSACATHGDPPKEQLAVANSAVDQATASCRRARRVVHGP